MDDLIEAVDRFLGDVEGIGFPAGLPNNLRADLQQIVSLTETFAQRLEDL